MFTLLPLAWVMVNMPRTAANRELIYTLHKSLELTVLALVAVRLILRAVAPQLPGSLARWERASAVLSHWLLYLIMLGMPVSGHLFSAWGGHPRHLFWAVHAPWPSEERYATAPRILGARRHRSMADLFVIERCRPRIRNLIIP